MYFAMFAFPSYKQASNKPFFGINFSSPVTQKDELYLKWMHLDVYKRFLGYR